jgi:hypothetical protein
VKHPVCKASYSPGATATRVLGRDIENGAGAEATGGRILYLLPGVRLYQDNVSVAFGIKTPVWTNLNESALQQGAEGKEKYRLICSGSILF